jgi:hypothetical protein
MLHPLNRYNGPDTLHGKRVTRTGIVIGCAHEPKRSVELGVNMERIQQVLLAHPVSEPRCSMCAHSFCPCPDACLLPEPGLLQRLVALVRR